MVVQPASSEQGEIMKRLNITVDDDTFEKLDTFRRRYKFTWSRALEVILHRSDLYMSDMPESQNIPKPAGVIMRSEQEELERILG